MIVVDKAKSLLLQGFRRRNVGLRRRGAKHLLRSITERRVEIRKLNI